MSNIPLIDPGKTQVIDFDSFAAQTGPLALGTPNRAYTDHRNMSAAGRLSRELAVKIREVLGKLV